MKSDLTCPVEITKVTVKRETEDTKENEQIVCLIEFFNLSDKVIDSLQMNIICFDADGTRLGGRLVRAAAAGEPRAHFSGVFMPEHVDGAVRVNASVEKVWYQDGVIWRREDRNVREYTPNALPEGRELDRLRAVAGPDAAGYAREDDIVWMCVCGRANRTSDDTCWRCEREREQVLRDYSFAAIDSTAGHKERVLEEQTKDTLRRSSEATVKEQTAIRKKSKRRLRAVKAAVALLALVVFALAMARWGVPYGASWYAQRRMDEGDLAGAKEVFLFVDAYWPGMLDAGARAQKAEEGIIEGLITAGSDLQLEEAAKRASMLPGEAAKALYDRAVIDRAKLAIEQGDTDSAEALLGGIPENEEAAQLLRELIYDIAMAAREKVSYPTAIARFESLGDYGDAREQMEECIYDYGRQLMREGEYASAQEQLLLVSARRDALALIRQCRYQLALEAQENGDFFAAAQAFESLGVYEEAETRAKICRYTAGMNALESGNLELAAEQLFKAEDYEDAQARYDDVAMTLGFTALEAGDFESAIEWLEQLPREGDVADALDKATYAYALELENRGMKEEAAVEYASLGDYEDARERARALEYDVACAEMEASPEMALGRFEGLGSYKDSKEKVLECRYRMARASYAGGDFEEAAAQFEALGAYEDAGSQARRSRYALANELAADLRYDEAAAQFESCGAYLDAEDRTMQMRYQKAQALEDEGDYPAAAKAYAALGSYEDAKLRVERCEDAWLKAPASGAKMDMELGDYDSVVAALAPLWQQELPARYAEIPEMFVEASLARAQELIDTNRPLDALRLLEPIEKESKKADKLLDAYVYRIIGRWKDSRGVEYLFRRDGSCSIAGEELYFGGSGYEICVGKTQYPTEPAYSVVNLRGTTLTLKDLETKSNFRLSYLGEEAQDEKQGE